MMISGGLPVGPEPPVDPVEPPVDPVEPEAPEEPPGVAAELVFMADMIRMEDKTRHEASVTRK
jgi:hypothetical protein